MFTTDDVIWGCELDTKKTRQKRKFDPLCLTTGQAAKAIRTSTNTIRALCDNGMLKSWKIPGSPVRRIDGRVLKKFAEKHNLMFDLRIEDSDGDE